MTFKIGDKVVDSDFGEGVVVDIIGPTILKSTTIENIKYPVCVSFKDDPDDILQYTLDGRYTLTGRIDLELYEE